MLKGRTAFITGTNRGIGKALVAEFARNGADVIAHARRETPEFLSMLEEIASKYSVKVSPLFFDMTNSEAMKTAVRTYFLQNPCGYPCEQRRRGPRWPVSDDRNV